MHVIAAKAVALEEALSEEFRDYQRRIVANASRARRRLAGAGLPHRLRRHGQPPVPGRRGVEGAHRQGGRGGPGGGGITVNKNTIPYDEKPPLVASGIRVGTPALTTRGMGEAEMDRVGDLMAEVLAAPEDARRRCRELCERFPLYDPLM
jgi:glycine hydroxymethyltransferase